MNVILLCILFILASAQHIDAAALHALVVADTTSSTGDAATKDLERLRNEIDVLCANSGLEPHTTYLSDQNVTASIILKAVQDLTIQPNDTVLFYFVGHGYRTSGKKGVWPLLFLSPPRQAIDLQDVIDTITLKHPRLGIVVADCCNNIIDGPVTLSAPLWEMRKKVDTRKNYRKLFVDSSGIILISAAKSGDYAYCEIEKGHCFTGAFFHSLHREIMRPDPQWADLLLRAKTYLSDIQEPYYEILSYP